jgi:hypothetical protein
MAGGMNRSTRGPTMAQRVTPTEQPPACPGRHCWVSDAVDYRGIKRPGLLVEWRRTNDGTWEGRVLYIAELRTGRWATVEEWLPSSRLTVTD